MLYHSLSDVVVKLHIITSFLANNVFLFCNPAAHLVKSESCFTENLLCLGNRRMHFNQIANTVLGLAAFQRSDKV